MKEYKNGDYTNYYETSILPSGQTIRIEFQEEWSKSKYFYRKIKYKQVIF